MKQHLFKVVSLAVVVTFVLSACTTADSGKITASGTFSAIDTSIAPELSGKVTEVSVIEGESVSVGQTLFKIDAEVSQAQYDQAAAAVGVAEAAVDASRGQAASAEAQYQLALQGALMQDMPYRQTAWANTLPDDYQEAWYFNETELIEAAQTQVESAEKALESARTELENEQKKASSKNFMAAEKRLALAQVTLTVASATLTQAQSAKNADLEDAAIESKDAAQAEFDAALINYQGMLTSAGADSILVARSRVAVAQATLDNARDALLALQTGDKSLQVVAAQKAVEATDSMVKQAEAGLEQAKQALKMAQMQLDRTTITSPVDGVVLTRNVEIGDLAVAGGTVMRVANLDTLDLVVYLSEDKYGQVNIGDEVYITVDSFAGKTFVGTIVRISDEAEFTPKNVQTESGRKSTVYAIKILVLNPNHDLKPGMPADVEFRVH
ncbi:MAG: HlyD family efflux transporter periplasmic adaptor subunit [Anaerolineaceae bacterium]|nr:HlyD family efflux transporter periplasmic adaptor subunit [Anaerolineaceae bacterium]